MRTQDHSESAKETETEVDRTESPHEPRTDDSSIALLRQAGLSREIAFQLRLAQLAVFDDLAKRIRPLDLTLGEFGALRLIQAQPELNQQQISDAMRIKKSNLVAMIGKLEQAGLVTRAVAAGDRRAYALRLTRKGERCVEKAEEQCRAHEDALAELLEPEERDSLLEALHKVASLGAPSDRT
jgi:DNA-binding MarR family transcriptional regulator